MQSDSAIQAPQAGDLPTESSFVIKSTKRKCVYKISEQTSFKNWFYYLLKHF